MSCALWNGGLVSGQICTVQVLACLASGEVRGYVAANAAAVSAAKQAERENAQLEQVGLMKLLSVLRNIDCISATC